MSQGQELILQLQNEIAQRFMPVFTPQLALQRYQMMKEMVESILKPGIDFGAIPGTNDKATLLKPGAEKLCTFFGLVPRYEYEEAIEHWGEDGEEPLFFYRVKCVLWRGDNRCGEGIGAASNRESKHRWRWVDDASATRLGLDLAKTVTRGGTITEPVFAVNKAETSGKYGKPAEYWEKWKKAIESGRAKKVEKTTRDGKTMDAWQIEATQYRTVNPEVGDLINTVLKIAQKRAYVAATLSATNASDYFTQDLEDFVDISYPDITPVEEIKKEAAKVDTSGQPVGTQAAADAVAQRKLAELDEEEPRADYAPAYAPPAPRPAQSALPATEELQVLWGQMANTNNRRGVYLTLHNAFKKLLGPDEGAAAYFDIVLRYGVKNPTEVKELSKHRSLVTDLYNFIKPRMDAADTA